MKPVLLFSLFAAILTPLRADTSALESRVAVLEQEVAALKAENQKLKDTSVDFLSAELSKKETERARLIYRTQVLPLVKNLATNLGAPLPKLPQEAEIITLIDAYRPFLELIAEVNRTVGSN
jgi:hypothetical protein